ncbi:MAG TPA: hypothetical protein HA254_07005 [Candidatus Diapherotrites archaeon]|uniref:Uncharacterized protein n=1 Tax=Candidatus Iainarchaeum sp. TaxID=3101447 RepID=A0A7J4IXX1_9ARCH|nr:hypothetical protein [Candidatus Diapherotrites archaeon]
MASRPEIGAYAFLAGAIIAIIGGLLTGFGQDGGALGGLADWIPLILIILGVIVGLLNIADREIDRFLIAAIALLALATTAGGLDVIPAVGPFLSGIVQNVAIFVAPAALITALTLISHLARD